MTSRSPTGTNDTADQDEQHLAYGEYYPPNSAMTDKAAGDSPPKESKGFGSFVTSMSNAFKSIEREIKSQFHHPKSSSSKNSGPSTSTSTGTRFDSFAPQRHGNDAKWFVDGCGYFWAVSVALEKAQKEIWILDWWLSPELYLRRPPAENQQYRLDRMLRAAAERGVKVNVIVYKEVELALTRKFISPHIPPYLQSLVSPLLQGSSSAQKLATAGLNYAFQSLETLERQYPLMAPPITVNSKYTKSALEALHSNISVFRHPDHIPESNAFLSTLETTWNNAKSRAQNLSELPTDILKSVYGVNEDIVLFWAHHEKLLLIDGEMAFMGGLDLCYGRWDMNQHSIADAHPDDLDSIVFPGQDYNNARIMDFSNVADWQNNAVDRCVSSRMGWSDVSMCLTGPVVSDLRRHFVNRWNFIYHEKYEDVSRYAPLSLHVGILDLGTPLETKHHLFKKMKQHMSSAQDMIMENMPESMQDLGPETGTIDCQLVRSCTKWSNGTETEHSVQNAYCELIEESQHFIYIENQFFITATGPNQGPVRNRIGQALVERILRAARNNEIFKVVVVIPAVPGFAGDLRSDDALGTREIMQLQYNSICRGGHSIMEKIKEAGFDPLLYIRFYNLRNYDRINSGGKMDEVEEKSGVKYALARKEADHRLDEGMSETYKVSDANGKTFTMQSGPGEVDPTHHGYKAYQAAAAKSTQSDAEVDTISGSYMLGGQSVETIPWTQSSQHSEIDAFVSEELYIHTKIMIVDDRIAIIGSANLNDRSQTGDHDSEIAMVIEDSAVIQTKMDGTPFEARKFATQLRRQLMRKHLGLLKPQDMRRPDDNFLPTNVAKNAYDFGSEQDKLVEDPICTAFLKMWASRAHENTLAFRRVFHPVPDDTVLTWKDYEVFYEQYFKNADLAATGKLKDATPPKYSWGHVVKADFSDGEEGLKEVKAELAKIQGNLVEMPIGFLSGEKELAKEGLSLNALTVQVYT